MTCTVWASCGLVANRDDGLSARIKARSHWWNSVSSLCFMVFQGVSLSCFNLFHDHETGAVGTSLKRALNASTDVASRVRGESWLNIIISFERRERNDAESNSESKRVYRNQDRFMTTPLFQMTTKDGRQLTGDWMINSKVKSNRHLLCLQIVFR